MKSATDIEKIDINYILEDLKIEFEELSNSKVLLTGCAGFLGFYIIKTIDLWNEMHPSKSITLFACDNFVRGKPQWLNKLTNKNILLFEHNVIEKLPDDINEINYIIHAASIASPIFYRKNPIETMDANVIGLRNLLDYSVKNEFNFC